MLLESYSVMFSFFPSKKFSEKMKNLSEGFIALAHSSGWKTEENFFNCSKTFSFPTSKY
jgi:hypothetical protein